MQHRTWDFFLSLIGLGNAPALSCRFRQVLAGRSERINPVLKQSRNLGIWAHSAHLGSTQSAPFHWRSTNSLPCFAGSFSLPQSSAKLLLIFWQLLWFQIKSLLISFRSSDSTFLLLLTHSFWQRSALCQFAIWCFSSCTASLRWRDFPLRFRNLV